MKKFSVFLCAVAMLLVFGMTGGAGACLIDFEDVPQEYWINATDGWTTPMDFYAGVSFGPTAGIVSNNHTGNQATPSPFYPPHSGDNWMMPGGILGIRVDFCLPADHVGFYFNTYSGLSLAAYDSADQLIAEASSGQILEATTFMGVDSTSFDIAYVLIKVPVGGKAAVFSIDDFEYNPAPVPEPATMLLLGTGLIGLAGLGRRKFLKR